uniref:Integrase catalytic domain-containing protein n=1 Tax=Thermosporothrix sp. COM3 TaxID=2490863 RepID=A0A455SW44_9CHLR|nr:hypothetical protein KTC_64990 [Thermosporothrix sp. COM3]
MLAGAAPQTLSEVREVTAAYLRHYNEQRPHQGRACGNRPPREVFPSLPQQPRLPEQVDPDAWLHAMNGRAFVRRVKVDGRMIVEHQPYYVKQALAGQTVALVVEAHTRQFAIMQGSTLLKRVPIKGLIGTPLPLAQFLEHMGELARSQDRLRRLQQRAARA